MPRACLRLVAALTLAAYFLLNTQLSVVFASMLAPGKNTPSDTSERTTRRCGCSKQSRSHEQCGKNDENGNRPSGCPCCPNGPCDGKQCPFPSICPHCGVAAAVCFVFLLEWTPPDGLVGTVHLSDVRDPAPPFLDGQARPPKA